MPSPDSRYPLFQILREPPQIRSKKAMELLPLGPVVLTDTPGLDDTGELGTLRNRKTQQILNTTDIALLVIDGQLGITEEDTRILQQIRQKTDSFCDRCQ